MATSKFTIDDFKDRLDSPFGAGGWDIEKKQATIDDFADRMTAPVMCWDIEKEQAAEENTEEETK